MAQFRAGIANKFIIKPDYGDATIFCHVSQLRPGEEEGRRRIGHNVHQANCFVGNPLIVVIVDVRRRVAVERAPGVATPVGTRWTFRAAGRFLPLVVVWQGPRSGVIVVWWQTRMVQLAAAGGHKAVLLELVVGFPAHIQVSICSCVHWEKSSPIRAGPSSFLLRPGGESAS